jgi:phosphoadenosine phosphosulfate reductase
VAQLAIDPRDGDLGEEPRTVLDAEEWRSASAALEGRHPSAAVRWALGRFPRGRVAVVTGLQADGVAAAAMALEVDPHVRLLTIDTGRLPGETYEYIDALRAHWRRDIEVVRPDPAKVVAMVSAHGADLFYISPERRMQCCAIRKVDALDGVMEDVDCWIVGLRREQSPSRADTPIVGEDPQRPGVTKVSPLAAWREEQAMDLLRERGVPLHPLYARGYRSIGCAPCTRAVRPGEPARAGRWWWEQGIDAECGLHVTAPGAGALSPARNGSAGQVPAAHPGGPVPLDS